jgi:rubrerythrin
MTIDGAASELRDQIAEVIRTTLRTRGHETGAADAVMAVPALKERLDLLAEYENAITWNTTCLACSRTLDALIKETERAGQAETEVLQLRAQVHAFKIAARAALETPNVRRTVQMLRATLSQAGSDDPPAWRCPQCGSSRWVASLTGPVEYGGEAIKQCIPCGHYSSDPATNP